MISNIRHWGGGGGGGGGKLLDGGRPVTQRHFHREEQLKKSSCF